MLTFQAFLLFAAVIFAILGGLGVQSRVSIGWFVVSFWVIAFVALLHFMGIRV